MKTCFRCTVEKPLTEFYKHPQMGDGYLGKCKDCTKQDVQLNRREKIEYYRAYDIKRAKEPHRKALSKRVTTRWRQADKRRTRAANAANRSKNITKPEGCQMCGKKAKRLEKHHPDYDFPLMVTWLCKPCHYLADRMRRESGL